jgi:hypothetical protein
MYTTTSIIALLPKATTGTIMAFTSSKSEMILTLTSKLLDGISKRAELNKTSKLMSLGPDCSTLLVSFLILGDHINLSLELSQLESKVLNSTTLLLLKILSMITSIKATKDTLKKEKTQLELSQTCVITPVKVKIGEDMSSMNSKVAERLFSLLQTQIKIASEQVTDDRIAFIL